MNIAAIAWLIKTLLDDYEIEVRPLKSFITEGVKIKCIKKPEGEDGNVKD